MKKTLLIVTLSILGFFWYWAECTHRQTIKVTTRRRRPVGTVHIRAMVTAWDPV